MYVPFENTRYHTLGSDSKLLEKTALYSDKEYELAYPFILRTKPALFSLNLRDEIAQFLTTAPPAFNATVHEVIDVACYYYSDWDSPMVVTDEFIDDQVLTSMRLQMALLPYTPQEAEDAVQFQIQMLSEALRTFISVIVGALARYGSAAVEDFGSIYRLDNIDEAGNVFFKIIPPDAVFEAVQENYQATLRATKQHKELLSGRIDLLSSLSTRSDSF